MKKILYSIAVAGFLCMGSAQVMAQEQTKYGKEFTTGNVMTVNSFKTAIAGKKELKNIQLEGWISQVCQAEGCWMKLRNDGGEDILVKFKDHSFLIPKDLAGNAALVHGNATRKVIPVEERRHMAEDAGVSKEEIAKITEPKEEIRIEATGTVVIHKNK
jgi:hypothetical protein